MNLVLQLDLGIDLSAVIDGNIDCHLISFGMITMRYILGLVSRVVIDLVNYDEVLFLLCDSTLSCILQQV